MPRNAWVAAGPRPPRRNGHQAAAHSVAVLAHIQALSDERDQRHQEQMGRIIDQITALDRITDAKFVTFRTLLDSNSEKVALALNASDKAVTKAEVANERRFESVNEFRAALTDQTRMQVSGDRFDSVIEAMNARMRNIELRVEAAQATKAGGKELWGYLAGIAGLLLALAAFITR